MDETNATAVIWRRLIYTLSPQQDIYERVSKFADGARILEIGFGTGIGILQYSENAEYVDAVEVDPAAVQFARKMIPLRNVRWLVDDITNPSRNYRGYDLVLMIEVLEHIHGIPKAIENFKGAMRRGGRGIITVPNSLRYRRRREGLNVREWSPSEYIYMLKQNFTAVHLLDANLTPIEDMEHRESPIVAGVFRGR